MSGRIAYFCMEFGMDERFPIYAGGLGILAGDYMKSAHDLGLPVVGVGLRYSHGYSRQRISVEGSPIDEFPEAEVAHVEDTGIRVRARVTAREVECRVWHTQAFGNAPLYLLEPIDPQDAWITHRLYDPTLDCRVAQEILLGIGGVRALRRLNLDVETYHFNEGHAVFAGIELMAERMAHGATFPDAWSATRQQIVFTTHTPVPAGNEEHPLGELRRLGACCELSDWEMQQVGGDPFNMTVAGLRLSRRSSAVSQLHGEVAREMWRDVQEASPIIAITNGVHVGTWQDERIRAARGSAEQLWEAHLALKQELLDAVRDRTGVELDPHALTIGFARRAASYKRSDLIFRDPSRIEPLLHDRRIQLVFSGKNHPDDHGGRRIVASLVEMSRRYPHAVVFVPNYNIEVGRLITRGADVWLNNPIRPMEASGTSGMKAAMNGVLNLSVLDGWWPEACQHGVNGWAIGDGSSDLPDQDERDANSLLSVLEHDVLPAYADRGRWLAMMQQSITMGEQMFSSDRMVRDYFERLYAAG